MRQGFYRPRPASHGYQYSATDCWKWSAACAAQHHTPHAAGDTTATAAASAAHPPLQRLIDLGVSLDIISISAPPRHHVPLFLFQSLDCIIQPVPAPTSSFARPRWLNLSFAGGAGGLKHAPIIIRAGRAWAGAVPSSDAFANAAIPTVAEAMAVLAQHQAQGMGGSERTRSDSGEYS